MLNPVLRREVRSSLRSWRSFLAISLYVSVGLGVVSVSLSQSGGMHGFDPRSAIHIHYFMLGFKLFLICLMIPAICAGAINGERERQTLDLMLITRMSTSTIVAGKLLSSLLFVLLLVAAGLPVFGVLFYYGGFSPIHLVLQIIFIVLTAAVAGSVAILFSAVFRRPILAIVASYLFMSLLTLGTLVFVAVVHSVLEQAHFERISMGGFAFSQFVLPQAWREAFIWVLAFNPIVGVLSLMENQVGGGIEQQFIGMIIGGLFRGISVNIVPDIPFWQMNMAFNAAISAVCVFVAAYIIKPVKRRAKNNIKVKEKGDGEPGATSGTA